MQVRTFTIVSTLAMALSAGAGAWAQEAVAPTGPTGDAAGPTLADLGKDSALTAAYQKMVGAHPMPEWIGQEIVVTPAQKVRFDGQDYLAMQGCKQHDCAANQFAMLYAPETGSAYGLLSTADGEGAELLTWLGLGGGAETVDGRTILYAAVTGSLANHPQDFSYE